MSKKIVKKGKRGSERKPSDRKASQGFFNPVDVHVGNRLRLRRTLLGFSQERLGDAIGLTFQQIQKYERGANRVSASRLFDFSNVLDVPVAYFFEEMPGDVQRQSPANLQGRTDLEPMEYETNPLARRETLELVRAYYKIPAAGIRKRIFELVKSLARIVQGDDDTSS